MIILKSSIQNKLDKAEKRGFDQGIKFERDVADSEKKQLQDKYEAKIMDLESKLKIESLRVKNALVIEQEAQEKSRLADERLIIAQTAALKVFSIMEHFGTNATRAKIDIENIADGIKDQVKKIMDK